MPRLRAVLASTAILAVLVAAGCGGGEKTAGSSPTTTSPAPTTAATPYITGVGRLTPTKIFARVKAALKAADSVHVKGRAEADGAPTDLDLALTRTGGKSVISMGTTKVTVITLGKTAYFQGNDAFWKSSTDDKQQGEAYAALFRGRWLKTTTGDKHFGDLPELALKDAFADSLKAASALVKTGPRIVDGFNCIGVRDKESVLWVDQVTGRPIHIHDATAGGDLTFTDYNRVPAPQAPPKNLVVDTSALN